MDYTEVRKVVARKIQEIDNGVRLLRERRGHLEKFLQASNALDAMGITLGETVEQKVKCCLRCTARRSQDGDDLCKDCKIELRVKRMRNGQDHKI